MVSGRSERPDPGQRAGDQDRDQTLAQLQEAYAQGRLSTEELHERLEAAVRARTLADLARLTTDLPGVYQLPEPRPLSDVARVADAEHGPAWLAHQARGLLALVLVTTVIWAVTGAGYYWPVWVWMWPALAIVMSRITGRRR
ncbi:MAG: DUF1707 SHOCT-like domain-containing protein [Actinomycetes bacterium]